MATERAPQQPSPPPRKNNTEKGETRKVRWMEGGKTGKDHNEEEVTKGEGSERVRWGVRPGANSDIETWHM